MISAVAGLATVVLNITLFATLGWAIEALRVGASIFSISTLIGALMLIAGKGFSGWLERFAAAERQRLALARALLKNAPILVLDEATANVDLETEHAIQDALRETSKKRTIIIIAHRLSAARIADEILVLDNGHLVERGLHEDLL